MLGTRVLRHAGHRAVPLISAAIVLSAVPALGQTTVQVPGAYSLSHNGPALQIRNTHDSLGAGNPVPTAITGIVTHKDAVGLLGSAIGASSIAVEGINGTSGEAGRFVLNGKAPGAASSAVTALNSGGSTTAVGTDGNAGLFQITNAFNRSPAVSIKTNGIDSYALQVINSGTVDFKVTNSPDGNNGGIGGYFEITSAQAQFGQAAILGVHSGGETAAGSNGRYGNAGRFVITNTNNFDSALVGLTKSDQGTGVEADDFSPAPAGGGGSQGVALLGQSTNGWSAQFTGGSGGTGTCSYDGSSGWNCPSDRNLKEDFVPADLGQVLDRIDRMPVYTYRMKGAKLPARYLGPTAQDFKAAFDLGTNDTTINTANAQGVALAAAKGLIERLKQDEATIAALKQQLAQQQLAAASAVQAQADRVARLEAAVAHLTERSLVQEAAR